MDTGWDEHDDGQLHFHDRWQFELKSEFTPVIKEESIYTQELYLFIPNALQINPETYSKAQFYQDEVNFIRFKTPPFTFKQLLDPTNFKSPIFRLSNFSKETPSPESLASIEDELKLLANIIRSALRVEVRYIFHKLESSFNDEALYDEVNQMIEYLNYLDEKLQGLWLDFRTNWKDPYLNEYLLYIQEFISNSVHLYISELLDQIRLHNLEKEYLLDDRLCEILLKEKKRLDHFLESNHYVETESKAEYYIYRQALLNKFVLDALLLKINRFTPDQKLKHVIEAISAGTAMLVYLLLFVWQGNVFVFNSLPFIIITVVLYMMKDRMKDILKTVSYKLAFKYFADYTTVISSENQKRVWGSLKEWFSFIPSNNLPDEITSVRNKEFHNVLEEIKRPEQIIYYKKIMRISALRPKEARRSSLNVIFRFNIYHFLSKASEPYENHVTLDPETHKFIETRLPKVYHLNIIMKNTYQETNGDHKVELKKFRIIIDKNGIKRIETLKTMVSEDQLKSNHFL